MAYKKKNPNKMAYKKKKTLSCYSINICGLSDRSRILLDKYVNEENPDYLCVQETRSTDLEKLKLTNMKVITDDNNAVNRGAALYISSKNTITKLTEINKMSKNIDATWGLGVIQNKRYILGSVYVKLNYNNAIKDVLEMLTKAESLMKKHKAQAVILTGDFNSRHVAWGDHYTNDYGAKLFDNLDKTKFAILTSNTPTFLSKNGSSYIDLTIVTVNMVEKMTSCKTDPNVQLYSGAPSMGHVPLIIHFSSEGSASNHAPIEKLNIDNIDWKKWSKDLDSHIDQNREDLDSMSDPEILNNFLTKAIQTITKQHGEKKIVTPHSKPFWTPELTDLRDQMNKASELYYKRNTDRNEEMLKEAKEAFDDARKKACENFLLDKTKNLNNVQKLKFWKEFNKLFKKKSEQSVEPLIDSDENILTNQQDMEELMFATFFEGKHLNGIQFDDQFYEETNRIYEEIVENNMEANNHTFDLNAPISMQEIKSSIKSYNSGGKSNDKEGFNPKMFKHLGEKFLKYLLKTANICFNNGKWIWSKSEVIFLRKSGKDSYSKPGSYRPISITSYIGKLIEKIIAKRIQKFLDLIGKHDPNQEGFMEGKNTIRYLNRLVTGIKSDIKKKLTSVCLFIDFEKAFDSIWKKGLIVKLFNLGIQGKILHLINSFLMERIVSLNINGVVGDARSCSDVGVPQGSALSPILFRIYVMDLAEEFSNNENIAVLKFADDGTVQISGTTTQECLTTLQEVMNRINAWSKRWRLLINCLPDKTEVICFNTAEKDRSLVPKTFKMGDSDIKLVQQTKVLGLILDENLNFEEHSKFVYKKLCHIWVKVCQYANRHWGFKVKTMLIILRTLFIPTLMYAGHIWMNPQNLKEINSLYYKMIKSTIGAVLNIKQNYAEIILGLPPLNIVTELNKIKHYLKLNMTQLPEDKLRELIRKEMLNDPHNATSHSIKQVWKYLKWKLENYPESIEQEDVQIIQNGELANFFNISPKSCKYTKNHIIKFTEYLWKKSIQNQLQHEGYSVFPNPRCAPILAEASLSRDEEVMILSMFYPNNLLNSSLHKINSEKFTSPLCKCGHSTQSIFHVLFQCNFVNRELRDEARNQLQDIVGEAECSLENSIVLLKASGNDRFMKTLSAIVKLQMPYLNTSVIL